MTICGVNITWTGAIAALTAVVGAFCLVNYGGAYLNQKEAESKIIALDEDIAIVEGLNIDDSQKAGLIAGLKSQEARCRLYKAKMERTGALQKATGQWKEFKKWL